jgi:molybdopterin-synthase adenylyltransferase
MSDSEILRYERQTRLPEIGKRGQKKIGKATVLIVGAGGIGSISSQYLAALGIGHILIADHDQVEISNLNRQILHDETSLGEPKVSSAVQRIKNLNSSIRVTPIYDKLNFSNINSYLKEVDIIVDGSDNYETRQVINHASIEYNIPWIFAGVQGFEGMVSTFIPGLTPCFECIIRTPENSDPKPGIIGPTAGIIASIQTMEVTKLILDIGTSLENKLLKISGLDMRIQTITIDKNPDCKVCNQNQK